MRSVAVVFDGGWTVAPGAYPILVGSSSCDIRLQGSINQTPTAVTLRSFTARRTGPHTVSLRWRTASELGLGGFTLYRGAVRVNRSEIPARHAAAGSSYAYVDKRAGSGAVTYRLEVIRTDGSRIVLGSRTMRR